MKHSILHELQSREADLPNPLQDILYQVKANNERCHSNLNTFKMAWADKRKTMQDKMPFINIEDCGDTVYTGSLSPGCRLCKQGKWDCIFMTMQCNLSCDFCCSPAHLQSVKPFSSFGTDRNQIATHYETAGIKGIAFTGGEPFLVFDTLVDNIIFFRKKFPDSYIWLYTNGILADKNKLSILSNSGIDEIRFNTAASGYENKHILNILERAAEIIKRVTVEIPCIPLHKKNIINSLPHWNDAGIKQLNLHELIKEPGSNSANLKGKFNKLTLEDGHITYISEESRKSIEDIMQAAHDQTPGISVNECSIQNKLRQIKGRRKNIAIITKEPFEVINKDGFLESCFTWRSKLDYSFCSVNDPMVRDLKKNNYVKLKRRPTLVLNNEKIWFDINSL